MNRVIMGGLMLLMLAGGCASGTGGAVSAGSDKPHAQCLVCKMNFDLACVDIAVDDKTPKFMYLGKDYYFCSEECRPKFAKDPGKYVAK